MQLEAFVPLSLRDSGVLIQSYVRDFAEALGDTYAALILSVRSETISSTEEECDVTLVTCASAADEAACCVISVDQAATFIGVDAFAGVSAPL